jgi:pimeloyl-ACP methyl ester carboxylesterase
LHVGQCESFDGALVRYRTTGPGSKRPWLVWIHGWGCHQGFWSRQLDAFADDFSVLALDLAGHGASSTGSRAGAIEEFARDVLAAADAASLPRFVAIGHSMGGAVAVEVARRDPTRVSAVVAVDALTYPSVYPRVPEEQARAAMAAFRSDFRKAVEDTMNPVFLPDADPALKIQILDEISATPREAGVAALGGLLRWDGQEAIASCPAPIVCLCAQAFLDREAVSRYAAGVEIETLAGVGHFLMREDPEGFNTALRRILRRVT